MHSESGLFVQSANCLRSQSLQIGRRNGEIFTTIDSLIQSRIKFSKLEFENFRQIFRVHFLVSCMVLAVFFGRLGLKRFKILKIIQIPKVIKMLKLLRNRIKRARIRFIR